jgi:hypothetical protein
LPKLADAILILGLLATIGIWAYVGYRMMTD